jgi:hypothetical protein
MTKTVDEMKELIKKHLKITDESQDMNITDRISDVVNYCNIGEDIPLTLEPFLRRKVKDVMIFETFAIPGPFDVKSKTAGDTTTSYAVDENHSKETIYGLSESDKKVLNAFRRLRR